MLHAAGIKLIVDIVPNHTSNRHEWFREALASPPGSAARDRYIFRRRQGPRRRASRRRTGARSSAAPPGSRSATASGTSTCSPRSSRTSTGTTGRGPGGLPDHAAVLGRPGRRRVPGRRRPPAGEGRLGDRRGVRRPADPGADRRASPTGSTRSRIGTRCTRSTRTGARSSTSTTRRGWRSPRHGCTPPTVALRQPGGPGPGLQLRPAAAGFRRAEFRRIIDGEPTAAQQSGASSTWVFSNHDMVRHATRYGLPNGTDARRVAARGRRHDPALDVDLACAVPAPRRCCCSRCPGPAYLYQGEELGLHEVGDLPADVLQDPTFFRSKGVEKGRDGCRVPLPWTDGGSFGFGGAARTCRSRSGSARTPWSASGRAGLDPALLHRGARGAAVVAGRRGADLAGRAA